MQVQLLLSLCTSPLHTQDHTFGLLTADQCNQSPTSVNNVVSQRGSIPASCIVDVDWLKVWVHLVVKARNEHYRDAHLYRLFSAWIQMNN